MAINQLILDISMTNRKFTHQLSTLVFFALLFNLGCVGSKHSKISFYIPPNYSGAVLIAAEGNSVRSENLLILIGDIQAVSAANNLGSIRFFRGDEILHEMPLANLYLDNLSLDVFGLWGKRYVEFGLDSRCRRDIKELGCGTEFAVFYVGNGGDAKKFFSDSAMEIEELIRLANASKPITSGYIPRK
jgi:hypothetical protein